MMGYGEETVPAGMQIRPVIMSYLKSVSNDINPLTAYQRIVQRRYSTALSCLSEVLAGTFQYSLKFIHDGESRNSLFAGTIE